MPNFVSCVVVGCDYSVDSSLRASHTLCTFANDEHVLLVFVIRLRCRIFFLRVLSSNQNLASRFFFKSLLVETFWSNEHANVINTCILGDVNLFLDL